MTETADTSSYTLLLTATLNPGEYGDLLDQKYLQSRSAEYENSLNFWMNYADPRITGICFCENSGADLAHLRQRYRGSEHRAVEFLSFEGNDRPNNIHYGYAELGLIDYAVAKSRLISQNQKFIKVTGRLIIPALSKLLNQCPAQLQFLADCHRYSSDKPLPVRMRTQLFISDLEFYKTHLYQTRSQMQQSNGFVEEFLIRKLWPLRNEAGVHLRFPVECQPSGYSASKGHHYDKGLSRAKSQIRAIIRRLIPNLWL